MLREELVGFKIVFSQNEVSTCTSEHCLGCIREVKELYAYVTRNNVGSDVCS